MMDTQSSHLTSFPLSRGANASRPIGLVTGRRTLLGADAEVLSLHWTAPPRVVFLARVSDTGTVCAAPKAGKCPEPRLNGFES